MTLPCLIWDGIRYHWRAHFGACVGAALCALVITGALLVGDSLRGTLHQQAAARVGRVVAALVGGEHFFRSALAQNISNDAAPVLFLRGSASKGDGSARLNQVQVMGVDARFWALAPDGERRELQAGDVVVSAALAQRLGVEVGESVVVRVEKPSAFSKDAPLSGEEDGIEALRARVVALADDSRFGRFALQAGQVAPATVFLPLEQLQQRLGVEGRANLILSSLAPEALKSATSPHWTPEDGSLEVRPLADDAGFEVRTSRVFLEDSLLKVLPVGQPSLTYFVNTLRSGEHATPYSMVSAVTPGSLPFLPADLAPDEIVVSDWLQQDLEVEVGGELEVSYLVLNGKRQFEEKARRFKVRAVQPLQSNGWDGSWMPDFPGLSDVGNCRDWKPGFALDTTRIREKDEAYWKMFKGAPKAFIALETGREMWGNRWGATTAIRYTGENAAAQVAAVQKAVTPQVAGVQVLPLRELADAATDGPVDFAGLFLGFSIFLVVASLALVGLLFGLSVESRRGEAGALLAMGWSVGKVRTLFLGEGIGVAVFGACVGTAGGFWYTQAVLSALSGVWRGATGGATLTFCVAPVSLVVGLSSAVLCAVGAMAWVSWSVWRAPIRELLSGEAVAAGGGVAQGRRGWGRWVMLASLGGGLALLGAGLWKREVNPEGFFGGGSLLLVALLVGCRLVLGRLAQGRLSAIRHLALRNAGRRPGRAVAVISVLAAGAFLVLSVEVFHKDANEGGNGRGSGTGGFALIGELAAPVYEDLNLASVRDNLGLPLDPAVNVVPIRVRDGEDASCLNLNRAVQPKLLGVPSEVLQQLGAFRFVEPASGWAVLRSGIGGIGPSQEPIPAAVDEDTLQWALQKKMGDVLQIPDGRGGMVRVRLAATLAGSILQGALLVDEARFIEAFPDAGGYRLLLLDAPRERLSEVRAAWSRALQDRGLELLAAEQRLGELQEVSNTYLAIFQVLGGLGVLLGALGVGVVAGRNALERRGELAILEAGGWRHSQVVRLLLWELLALVAAGLVVGGGCAWLVTVPGQWLRGVEVNPVPLLLSLSVLGTVAFVSVRVALALSLSGRVGEVLRRE
jgi:putative ABC transport system permease protein